MNNICPPPHSELGDACKGWQSGDQCSSFESVRTFSQETIKQHKHCVIFKCCKNRREDSKVLQFSPQSSAETKREKRQRHNFPPNVRETFQTIKAIQKLQQFREVVSNLSRIIFTQRCLSTFSAQKKFRRNMRFLRASSQVLWKASHRIERLSWVASNDRIESNQKFLLPPIFLLLQRLRISQVKF